MQRNSSFFWNATSERSVDGSTFQDSAIGLSIDDVEDSAQSLRSLGFWGRSESSSSPPPPPPSQQPLTTEPGEGTPLLLEPLNERSSQQQGLPSVVQFSKGKKPFMYPRYSYNSKFNGAVDGTMNTIRFQVVVWHVGQVDVVQSTVSMRFRVTLFWNDLKDSNEKEVRKIPALVLTMQGRMHACQEEISYEKVRKTIDVPPISILNAVQFETIGAPEIAMIKEETRHMRWTCMYSATLFQGDNMRVDKFPHDEHDLVLKLGILANRRSGQKWDKRKWSLGLAAEQDSQGSTLIPHGLLVDHVSIPDFKFRQKGLQFSFVPLPMGAHDKIMDQCLQVKLSIVRESRHYDKNIMPLLVVLNFLAITCLVRNFASATASTETMLSIAFVEIGIRLTVDNRLPCVAYQIKFQTVLNQCFFLLCYLVLETNTMFFLVKKRGWDVATTDWIDLVVAIFSVGYTFHIWTFYYWNWKLIPLLNV